MRTPLYVTMTSATADLATGPSGAVDAVSNVALGRGGASRKDAETYNNLQETTDRARERFRLLYVGRL